MVKKKYILAIIAVLLCIVFSLTGCEKTYQAGEFSYRPFFNFGPCIGIKSDTDKFAKDNVTFDFYCGLYNITEKLRNQYDVPNEEEIVFVIYACKAGADNLRNIEVVDYKNINGYYYIKEISEKEALSERYGYTVNRDDGIVYNSIESITIPKNVFFSQNDRFSICLVAYYCTNNQENNTYKKVRQGASIELKYEFLSKDEIKIYYE